MLRVPPRHVGVGPPHSLHRDSRAVAARANAPIRRPRSVRLAANSVFRSRFPPRAPRGSRVRRRGNSVRAQRQATPVSPLCRIFPPHAPGPGAPRGSLTVPGESPIRKILRIRNNADQNTLYGICLQHSTQHMRKMAQHNILCLHHSSVWNSLILQGNPHRALKWRTRREYLRFDTHQPRRIGGGPPKYHEMRLL